MLPAITPNAPLKAPQHRPQATRSHDSEGGINVLGELPTGLVMGRIELLGDTTELLPALMEAINEARTSIKADFDLLKGAQGQELARQLARRARQGLRVQVLAWGAPTPVLVEAVKVARSQGLTVRLAPQEAQSEGHGKFLLVDDRLALIGQITPAPQTRFARRGLLRLVGEAACELGRQFNHDWAAAGGTPMPLPDLSRLVRAGSSELHSMIQLGGAGAQRKSAKAMLLTGLGRARRFVLVAGDLIDDAEVIKALVAAKKRGVQVKVLLSGLAPASRGWAAGDGQTRAMMAFGAAGIQVRRYQAQGALQAVETRYAIVDGESLLWSTAPWTRAGLASGGEVMLEARGGRELLLIQATFMHDWQNAAPTQPPSTGNRLRARIAPALTELSRLMGRYSPAKGARALLNTHVGVVKYPNGKLKLITETR